ncbi:DUF3225 domain-containing protein, partial [Salmonella enterica]|nr:DUF3225 domain-containing protein [Salmonella enterica]
MQKKSLFFPATTMALTLIASSASAATPTT